MSIDALLGARELPFLIAEIGINHNGDVEIAKQLILEAKQAGFDAVKFQKRTVDIVYSQKELDVARDSVFGTTNRDLKYGLEFDRREYQEIDAFCKELEIPWSASPWDVESLDFLLEFNVPFIKIASASLTNSALLRAAANTKLPTILSTGMSSLEQIERAIGFFDRENICLLHTVSTYPASNSELNLSVIDTLRECFRLHVGYSGHEVGVLPSVIAYARYGAVIIERHITLNRAMWGSDQAASLEPQGMVRLVQYIQEAKESFGSAEKRILESEIPVMQKLRKVRDF